MQLFLILIVAAIVFGLCYLVDKTFAKLFRSRYNCSPREYRKQQQAAD